MMTDADDDGGRPILADALAYIATVGVSMIGSITGASLGDVLTNLNEPAVQLIPLPATVPWAEAKGLIERIPSGEGVAAASRWMDIPGAANGTFAVGVSAFQDLQARTGKSAVALLDAVITAPIQSS